ncbi:MAG: glucosamine-6-phosphate deaminase [Alphaproteobacteria bacterium]|nr:glucosamine-6-phosphate deaminase [Alphaproteobacteria bacterium]
MRVIIKEDAAKCATFVAGYIAYRIKQAKPTSAKPFVLGLPTGSTPLGVYKELIAMYKNKKISFENVVTFNMDEYVGLDENNPQSYHYFMFENFFNHINVKRENIHILNGMTKDYAKECDSYERAIAKAGGIDLFLGGVGSDGHIAFNEPFSSLTSRTRIKTLAPSTIKDNSRFFGGDMQKVPTQALTVGVGTIMDAKEVIIMATGAGKAEAVCQAVEGNINHRWTVSALQTHRHGMIVCDEQAAGGLSAGTKEYFNSIENR